MSKTRSPGFRPGDHWVTCDRCGFAYRHSETVKEWNGLVVCKSKCWEPRHPQDFVRGVRDSQAPGGNVRPDPTNVFVSNCTGNNTAGQAVAGCAIAGGPSSSVPSGSFTV
jgi:hypothetical protein